VPESDDGEIVTVTATAYGTYEFPIEADVRPRGLPPPA